MTGDEALFVGFDPRAVIDLESSLGATWPTVARHGGSGAGVCIDCGRGGILGRPVQLGDEARAGAPSAIPG